MAIKFIVGLLIALVSGLGVGGGGLFAVYLSLCTDTPQLSIQGFNLMFFIFSATASVIVQVLKKRVKLGMVAVMAVGGILGAVGGSLLATAVAEEYLRKAFGVMLTATGILSLKNSLKQKNSTERGSK